MMECERCCADEEGVSYLHQFTFSGSRKATGSGGSGLIVMAFRFTQIEVLTVEIEPVRDLKVECYASGDGNGNWFSSYDDKNGRSCGYPYDKHYYEDHLHTQENLVESILHQQLTYHEVYEEKVYPKLEWWSSFCEEENKSYGYGYNKHRCEEALHVEENLVVPMLHQRLTYHKVYDEQLYPKLETRSSYSEHDDERNVYGNYQYVHMKGRQRTNPLCRDRTMQANLVSKSTLCIILWWGVASCVQ